MSARRQLILEAIRTRLQDITVAHGYQTNTGATVFLQETPLLGSDDPDQAIAVLVGVDDATYQGEHVVLMLPIELQALAKASLSASYLAAEAVLADIKKAMELADRTLGGLVLRQFERASTRTLARNPGSTTVGVGVTYRFPYRELWGTP